MAGYSKYKIKLGIGKSCLLIVERRTRPSAINAALGKLTLETSASPNNWSDASVDTSHLQFRALSEMLKIKDCYKMYVATYIYRFVNS